jgi:hypothetical protein
VPLDQDIDLITDRVPDPHQRLTTEIVPITLWYRPLDHLFRSEAVRRVRASRLSGMNMLMCLCSRQRRWSCELGELSWTGIP